MGPDFWQMAELENERRRRAERILSKAQLARRDGYFTDEDLADIEYELGLSTHYKHSDWRHT